jgi:hypothetical protein
MTLGVVEIYNDIATDFLRRTKAKTFGEKVKVSKRGVCAIDVQNENVSIEADLHKTVRRICALRSTEPTKYNPSGSSRSHLVMTFTITCQKKEARLVFVDLAGCEKSAALAAPLLSNCSDGRTNSRMTGDRPDIRTVEETAKKLVKERNDINSDLQELRRKVRDLSRGDVHGPSRTLSKVLQPSLTCADVNYIGLVTEDADSGDIKRTLEHLCDVFDVKRTDHQ